MESVLPEFSSLLSGAFPPVDSNAPAKDAEASCHPEPLQVNLVLPEGDCQLLDCDITEAFLSLIHPKLKQTYHIARSVVLQYASDNTDIYLQTPNIPLGLCERKIQYYRISWIYHEKTQYRQHTSLSNLPDTKNPPNKPSTPPITSMQDGEHGTSMLDGDSSDAPMITDSPSGGIINPRREDAQDPSEATVNGKFTLTIDCTVLLQPSRSNPDFYVGQSTEALVEHFQLGQLTQLAIIDQVKVKMYHTCGFVDFVDVACMHTLWHLADWIMAQYQNRGKRVEIDRKGDGRGRDWAEPDAYFTITVG